jgi:hypothetical protein
MNLEVIHSSFFTQPILWVHHAKSNHDFYIGEPMKQLKTQLCNNLWACHLHCVEHLNVMKVVHMNVNTLNTSMMMEPVFLITNIEHQIGK